MTPAIAHKLDPKLDLVLERVVDVPPNLVWAAWTTPEYVKKWFTPAPWQTIECEIDLRPGGIFRTLMRSPEGQEFPNIGCYLEVIENQKLVWTAALKPGYPPAKRSRHAALYCGDPARTARRRNEVHRDRDPRRPRKRQKARGHGLSRRLGQSPRPAPHPREDDVSR
jgi:uncharacterized protein YndB with AHSA1/START domain